MYSYVLIILILILLVLVFINNNIIFIEFQNFWNNLRLLFYNNKTLFDILFLCLYLSQQLALFIFVLIQPNKATIIAGGFAILVIATISFEKICMESRYNYYKSQQTIYEVDKMKIVTEYHNLESTYNNLVNAIESNLKGSK